MLLLLLRANGHIDLRVSVAAGRLSHPYRCALPRRASSTKRPRAPFCCCCCFSERAHTTTSCHCLRVAAMLLAAGGGVEILPCMLHATPQTLHFAYLFPIHSFHSSTERFICWCECVVLTCVFVFVYECLLEAHTSTLRRLSAARPSDASEV